MKMPAFISAIAGFVKAINRDRLTEAITRDLQNNNAEEAFRALNRLSHEHGKDPQIETFFLQSLETLYALDHNKGAYANYSAIFYTPKNGPFQEKVLERFSQEFDETERDDLTPGYLDHYLYALSYAGDASPAKKALLQKITDIVNTVEPQSRWKDPLNDDLFTNEKILELLFISANIAGLQSTEGKDALEKWNGQIARIAREKGADSALSAICAIEVERRQDPELTKLVGDKAFALFSEALKTEDRNSALYLALRVAHLSGNKEGIVKALEDFVAVLPSPDLDNNPAEGVGSDFLNKKNLTDKVKATGLMALLLEGNEEREKEKTASWSVLFNELASKNVIAARQAVKDVGGHNHGMIAPAARDKLPALSDLAAAEGNMWAALEIARDHANMADPAGTQWLKIISQIKEADINEAFREALSDADGGMQSGENLRRIAAETFIEMAKELAQSNPSEGLKQLYTIGHFFAGGKDALFGSKVKEKWVAPAAAEAWSKIVTSLAETDHEKAREMACEARDYWNKWKDKGTRKPGAMYKTADRMTRRLGGNDFVFYPGFIP